MKSNLPNLAACLLWRRTSTTPSANPSREEGSNRSRESTQTKVSATLCANGPGINGQSRALTSVSAPSNHRLFPAPKSGAERNTSVSTPRMSPRLRQCLSNPTTPAPALPFLLISYFAVVSVSFDMNYTSNENSSKQRQQLLQEPHQPCQNEAAAHKRGTQEFPHAPRILKDRCTFATR